MVSSAFSKALYFVLITLFVPTSCVEYTVVLTPSDSKLSFTATPDTGSASSSSISGNAVQLKPLDDTALKARLNSVTTAYGLDSNYFQMVTYGFDDNPLIAYGEPDGPSIRYFFGDLSEIYYSCAEQDLIQHSRLPFTCAETNASNAHKKTGVVFKFEKITDTNKNSLPSESWAGKYSMKIVFAGTPSEPTKAAALTLAYSRLFAVATLQTISFEVLANNEARLKGAQTAMLWIYFSVVFVCFVHTCLLGTIISWLWAPFTCCKCDPPKCLPTWSTLIWILIVDSILLFSTIGGGLLAGIIIMTICWIALPALYCYMGCAARKQLNKAIAVGAAEDNLVSQVELAEMAGNVGRLNQYKSEKTPVYMQPRAIRLAVLIFFVIALINGIIVAAVFFGFSVTDLQLWDREKGALHVEFIPQGTAKGILITYAWPQLATNFKLAIFMKGLTDTCGATFTKKLSGDEKEAIKTDWIDKYDLDMSEFFPEDYKEYNSVNDWFIRPFKAGMRPVAPGADVLVSPADARTLAFDQVGSARVWIKGGLFTVAELLDDIEGGTGKGLAKEFENGHLLISRLAPQDYHRFHTPLDGTLVHMEAISGNFWSVGKDAATSGNYAFYNERKVLVFENDRVGRFVYIAIGATCVGSTNIEVRHADRTTTPYKIGDFIAKGAELGNMQFGGSTVLVILPPGSVQWDDDLLYAASLPVESYLHQGRRLGVIKPKSEHEPLPPSDRRVNVGLEAGPIIGMSIASLLAVVLATLGVNYVIRKYHHKDIKVDAKTRESARASASNQVEDYDANKDKDCE